MLLFKFPGYKGTAQAAFFCFPVAKYAGHLRETGCLLGGSKMFPFRMPDRFNQKGWQGSNCGQNGGPRKPEHTGPPTWYRGRGSLCPRASILLPDGDSRSTRAVLTSIAKLGRSFFEVLCGTLS
jgi:hypothetical protein